MSGIGAQAVVLGFPDYRPQAERFAAAVGVRYADIEIHRFPDGESLVRLPDNVAGHVILCRTLTDANQRLIELELAASTARRLGAERVTLVAPYLCYMRQDKAFHPGEAISQQVIGKLLARQVDALVTIDPHLHRTPRLRDAVPLDRVVAASATSLMAEWLVSRETEPLIVGPDEEALQWVIRIASAGRYEYCVARKRRLGDRDVRIELPALEFAGRDVVLVDDVVSTGHTLAEAARQLADKGVASVTVLVCHPLFANEAFEHLRSAGVHEIVSTDSIPHPSNRLHLANLLAEALQEAWSDEIGTEIGV